MHRPRVPPENRPSVIERRADARAYDGRGGREHLLHARAAARAFVADHHHVAVLHLAGQDAAQRVLLRLVDARGALELQHVRERRPPPSPRRPSAPGCRTERPDRRSSKTPCRRGGSRRHPAPARALTESREPAGNGGRSRFRPVSRVTVISFRMAGMPPTQWTCSCAPRGGWAPLCRCSAWPRKFRSAAQIERNPCRVRQSQRVQYRVGGSAHRHIERQGVA